MGQQARSGAIGCACSKSLTVAPPAGKCEPNASTTFSEILMLPAGGRGFRSQDWPCIRYEFGESSASLPVWADPQPRCNMAAVHDRYSCFT